MKHWKTVLAAAGATMAATPALAQEVRLTPLVDARLRYEQVDQDGIADQSDALTVRLRSGVQASDGPFSLLVESEATLALDPHYNDGVNGKALPLVADPQNVELNRAQLRYADHGVAVTAGRQLLELADQRFVGSSSWRQNQQTFDAVRVQWSGVPRLSVDVSYAWSVRTVNGIQGNAARPQSVPGDNVFALASYAAPIGTVTGFAYLVDQDLPALSGFRLSSQTYGVRFAGARSLGEKWKLAYVASFARQSDYGDNPNRYAASYYFGEATLTRHVVAATAGYEVLGADGGAALTSMQTPLASFFRFNGWAGKFGTTPPDGLRDLYGTLAANWSIKGKGLVHGLGLAATFHHFDADRLATHYGDEVDVMASAKLAKTLLALRFVRYRADHFATNTNKLFVTLDWAFQ